MQLYVYIYILYIHSGQQRELIFAFSDPYMGTRRPGANPQTCKQSGARQRTVLALAGPVCLPGRKEDHSSHSEQDAAPVIDHHQEFRTSNCSYLKEKQLLYNCSPVCSTNCESPYDILSDGPASLQQMGGCQNYGPFLGTLNIRYRIIIRTQKGTLILTTTQMYSDVVGGTASGARNPPPALCPEASKPQKFKRPFFSPTSLGLGFREFRSSGIHSP